MFDSSSLKSFHFIYSYLIKSFTIYNIPTHQSCATLCHSVPLCATLCHYIPSFLILFYPVLSHHLLLCFILSYSVPAFPILSQPFLSCPILSCRVPSFLVLSFPKPIFSYSTLTIILSDTFIQPSTQSSQISSVVYFRLSHFMLLNTLLPLGYPTILCPCAKLSLNR